MPLISTKNDLEPRFRFMPGNPLKLKIKTLMKPIMSTIMNEIKKNGKFAKKRKKMECDKD